MMIRLPIFKAYVCALATRTADVAGLAVKAPHTHGVDPLFTQLSIRSPHTRGQAGVRNFLRSPAFFLTSLSGK